MNKKKIIVLNCFKLLYDIYLWLYNYVYDDVKWRWEMGYNYIYFLLEFYLFVDDSCCVIVLEVVVYCILCDIVFWDFYMFFGFW